LTAPVDGSYFQPVDLIETSLQVKNFTIGDHSYQVGDGFYITATGEQEINANEIVFIGYGIDEEGYSDLENLDIENKVVLLINEGEPVKDDGTYYISGTKEASAWSTRSEEHTSELQSRENIVCRLLLEKIK